MMFSQKNIYKLAVTGALLLAGCTSDDVAFEAAPAGSVPLSFTCTSDDGFSEDGQEGTRAVLGYQGPMDSEDLRHTGFGVFASQRVDGTPDMMYNQEVKFTYTGDKDDPLKGFWSYQPTKYWPSDLTHFYIGAYAPYQDPVAVDSDEPGIIGISENSHEPYIEFRRSLKPEDCVDLLWYFGQPSTVPAATADHEAGTLAMNMGHALARLEVSVKLASDPPPPANTKVLLESIEIFGSMASEGRLMLNKQITETKTVGKDEVTVHYPKWDLQKTVNHRFLIDNDESNNGVIYDGSIPEYRANYGIIDANVRYVEGLPYKWQPAGLSTTAQNVLSDLDRKTYIYLIPKAEAQSLTVNVKYRKMTDAGADDTYNTGSQTAGITLGNPLRGNTPYKLTITLKNI